MEGFVPVTKDTTIFQRAAIAAKFLIKGGISGSMITMFGGSSAASRYNVTDGSKAVTSSAVIAACIGRWGIEYPQVRMVVKNRKGEPDYSHPFMSIMAKPNELMDESEFYALISIYRCLTGTAYIHKLRNLVGNVVGYEPMHAYELVKGYDMPGVHTHYTFTNAIGERKRVPIENVVAMPWVVRNPADVSMGVSPLQTCWSQHVAYDAIDQFVAQFISNGAVPGTAFIAKGDFGGTDEDKKKFKDDLQYRYGLKSGGVGGSILLEGDFDVKRISANLGELALNGLRETPEANITAAFFVPPELVGVNVGLQNSTYSNKKEARRGFCENILLPMWENDASRFGKILTCLLYTSPSPRD
jgi:phage portal protein BeeE